MNNENEHTKLKNTRLIKGMNENKKKFKLN